MFKQKADLPDVPSSDDSSILDFFPSSPSSQRFTSPPPEDDLVSKRRTLPVELIEHIVKLFYQRYHSFRALRSMSLANSELRRIVLRRYMTSLEIHSAKQLASLLNVHISTSSSIATLERVGFHWVRCLTAPSVALANAPWRPSLMTSLRSLHITFATEAKCTQKIRAKLIFDTPLKNSPMTQLTSLTLTGLWCIDVALLSMVSRAFPALSSLYLSCSEHLDVSCCWACFEESSLDVVHSPIPNHFPTVTSLTNAFANALKPLCQLVDLHLGIFLSDEEMLERHIEHYDSPRAYSHAHLHTPNHLARGEMVLSQSESSRRASPQHVSYTEAEQDVVRDTTLTLGEMLPFPHGPESCPICSTLFSEPEVRMRELEATLGLARKLKSLRTVGWSSFSAQGRPSEDVKKVGDWQRAIKTHILRRGGRVRVRRQPWD